MYKVSIILPIYNVSQYLRECLDSVVRQTLREIEILCVNDGSTDDSLEIIQEYASKDSRIVVITGPNGGYGKAMNKGLDRAAGEYIGIVEPDDYVSLTMFEDLYNAAKANDMDIVKADFYRFGRNERGDMNLSYIAVDSTKSRYHQSLNPSHDPSVIKFVMNTWSGIYRRSFLEKYHIRHNETPGASFQDNGFFFQTMVYAESMMLIDKPYYRNRRDNPNSSVRNKEKVYCSNIEYDYIKELLMRDQEIWERFKHMYTWKKFHNYLFTVQRIADEFRQEYLTRISAEFGRALQQGECAREDFTELEWEKLMLIVHKPQEYYRKYVVEAEKRRASARNSTAERELELIKNSTTYKVGKLIMASPCAIKDKLVTIQDFQR